MAKRKFEDTQLPNRSPHPKRRHIAIDTTATGSSSPLSEISEDRLPSAEEFRRFEQYRLAWEKQDLAQMDKLHEKLKSTLAQIKMANKGSLTHEAFECLQSEVSSSHSCSNPKAQYTDAATNARNSLRLVRSMGAQTETVQGPSTATQTTTSAYDGVATQTESLVSDASIQTNPVPKPSLEEAYRNDLQYIRRATPLISTTNVTTVKCRLRKVPTSTPSISRTRTVSYLPTPSMTRSSAPLRRSDVVSLVDDDDDDVSIVSTSQGNWRTGGHSGFVFGSTEDLGDADVSESEGDEEAIQNVEFYGIQPTALSDRLLRYQDTRTRIGEYPSPTVGIRLDCRQYLHEIGSRHRRDPIARATSILQRSSWGITDPIVDDGTAIASNWTRRGACQVYNGFPLVEDVEFIVHRNNPPQDPDGDCYWRSVAFCLYGSDEHWDVVKAEHLGYMYHVLSQPRHPRHYLYSKHLNSRFFDTSSVGSPSFKANIWQLLHLAHAWTPAVVSQITADLYNICVIIFTLENGTAAETNVRGVYNSRHIFMCFTNGCHFQPMTPNHYDAWEFRYPRITIDATAKYVNAPKATSAKQTWEHPWRKEFSSTVLPPVPRLHGCDVEELRKFLGSKPRT
ncbi:uncharacterized protein PG998_003670 [Apiospora kogelbergensis]